MPSYSGLTTYRKCPRLYGFGLLGYKPIEVPEAMQTGSFVHAAIAAHFRNTSWQKAIEDAFEQASNKILKSSMDADKATRALKSTSSAAKRAKGLADSYIGKYTLDYSAPLIETWIELGSVRGIVDLIACYQDQRVIVDYKTSKSPDMRWYDVSGQIDLYAYMLKEQETDVALVIYDVISDEGVFRQVRPPRLQSGCALWNRVIALPKDIDFDLNGCLGSLLDEPHFAYDCPNRCDFWLPCWVLETADWSSCQDYLEANFEKKEEK